MTKILHIPTGTILTSIKSYDKLEGLFTLNKETRVIDSNVLYLANNSIYEEFEFREIIKEFDNYNLLDDEDNCHYRTYESGIAYLQDNMFIEEFEVLDD